jgi:hypothetical protein
MMLRNAKFIIYFPTSRCFANMDYAARIVREFSVLIYHLGDEEYAYFWLQFRDVVSPHRHDHHQYTYTQRITYIGTPVFDCINTMKSNILL